jgi:Zn-dependent M32 family carboxypeptidase
MEKILLSKEELNESRIISQVQNDLNSQIAQLTIQIESLKFQRKNAIEEFSIFEEKNKAFYEEIANKYGFGSIDLETGELIPNEAK